jgi:ABC-type lipoprotein export system ATPase subunit
VAVIEARGLSSVIPHTDRPLLQGVNLTVQDSESVAILGRSGSGKTSLLSILGLMQRAEEGTLAINGRDVTAVSESDAALLRNELIGFVFQNYSLIPDLSVFDNVAVPLQYSAKLSRSKQRSRVMEMLELVKLQHFASSRPARLSGGEQQRVAIARALVRGPKVVLADEPTGALDFSTRDEIIMALKDASSAAGSCLIVVTHDATVAKQMDRRLFLNDGALGSKAGAS